MLPCHPNLPSLQRQVFPQGPSVTRVFPLGPSVTRVFPLEPSVIVVVMVREGPNLPPLPLQGPWDFLEAAMVVELGIVVQVAALPVLLEAVGIAVQVAAIFAVLEVQLLLVVKEVGV